MGGAERRVQSIQDLIPEWARWGMRLAEDVRKLQEDVHELQKDVAEIRSEMKQMRLVLVAIAKHLNLDLGEILGQE